MNLRSTVRLSALGCLALFVAALYWHSQVALVSSVLLVVSLAIVTLRSLTEAARGDEREWMRTAAVPHLQPGERIQAAFAALGGPGPYLRAIVFAIVAVVWMLLGRRFGEWLLALLLATTTRWVVVATDRAILMLRRIPPLPTAALVARLPRHTRLGPVSGRWAMISLNATWLFVHRRFHAEIALADSVAAPPDIVGPSDSGLSHGRPRHPVWLRRRGPRLRS